MAISARHLPMPPCNGFDRRAPAVLVIAASYRRTAAKYGVRARRYVAIEAGHAAQAAALEAVSLQLATVDVSAFDDAAVQKAVALAEGEEPLLILPVRRPRRDCLDRESAKLEARIHLDKDDTLTALWQ